MACRSQITPANAEIQIGQSVRLSARALDAQGKEVPGVKLSWFSGGGEGQVDHGRGARSGGLEGGMGDDVGDRGVDLVADAGEHRHVERGRRQSDRQTLG